MPLWLTHCIYPFFSFFLEFEALPAVFFIQLINCFCIKISFYFIIILFCSVVPFFEYLHQTRFHHFFSSSCEVSPFNNFFLNIFSRVPCIMLFKLAFVKSLFHYRFCIQIVVLSKIFQFSPLYLNSHVPEHLMLCNNYSVSHRNFDHFYVAPLTHQHRQVVKNCLAALRLHARHKNQVHHSVLVSLASHTIPAFALDWITFQFSFSFLNFSFAISDDLILNDDLQNCSNYTKTNRNKFFSFDRRTTYFYLIIQINFFFIFKLLFI